MCNIDTLMSCMFTTENLWQLVVEHRASLLGLRKLELQEVVDFDGDVRQDVGRVDELHHTLLHLNSAVAVLLWDNVAARDAKLFNPWTERELRRLNWSKHVCLVVLIGAHLATENGACLIADCP